MMEYRGYTIVTDGKKYRASREKRHWWGKVEIVYLGTSFEGFFEPKEFDTIMELKKFVDFKFDGAPKDTRIWELVKFEEGVKEP